MIWTTRSLAPDRFPDLLRLFGDRGACGGCWCQWWRVPRGGRAWEAAKGAPNRAALERQVLQEQRSGVLCYADGEPAGWCAFDPRVDLPRLDTVRAYRGLSAPDAWAVHCFYIPARWRRQGVATRLLAAALDEMRRRGVPVVEGYPVVARRSSGDIPAAFAWTGPLELFLRAGFEAVPGADPGKPVVRRSLVGDHAGPESLR